MAGQHCDSAQKFDSARLEAVGRTWRSKALLSRATRPNVKQVLASFIKMQTARELELPRFMQEGEDPLQHRVPPTASEPARRSPRRTPGSGQAYRWRRASRSRRQLSRTVSPAPTKLVRAGPPPPPKTTWVAPAYGEKARQSPWVNVLISLKGVAAKERYLILVDRSI